MLSGMILLCIAGLCQGTFALGYKRYEPFSWEAFWGIYCLFCMIISTFFTVVLMPDFIMYYTETGIAKTGAAVFAGGCWGLSAILFSKAVGMIGVSLVYGLSMGISSVVGSLLPMLLNQTYLPAQQMLLLGIGVIMTLIGTGVVTYAGLLKEKKTKSAKICMKTGIVFTLLSGLGSAAMNVGFSFMESSGLREIPYARASAFQWLPVLLGGCLAGTVYCTVELFRKHTWHTFTGPKSGRRCIVLFLTSIVWYLALYFYGVAANLLGRFGTTIGWVAFQAIALFISNAAGLAMGEWKESTRSKKLLFLGDVILVVSWVFVAISNL
ncbi:MAG: L-rhamnose/proton symporter RhaT [Lachnospiraceae bacterium]